MRKNNISQNRFNDYDNSQNNTRNEATYLLARNPGIFRSWKAEKISQKSRFGDEPRNGQSAQSGQKKEEWEMVQNGKTQSANRD